MIVPPFSGVTLVEYRDHIAFTPVCWYREFVGVGRRNAAEVGPQPGDDLHPMFKALIGEGDIWVVVNWRRYDDETEEVINIVYLDSQATIEEARQKMDEMVRFLNMSKKQLESLATCFRSTEDDLAYIGNRFPDGNYGPPEPPKSEEDYARYLTECDLYQARLKLLAGIQPKTVELVKRAEETKDPPQRLKFEREAISAYFAELAHFWTEDLVLAWQRSNPIGSEWMCEFGRVLQEPELHLDPIKHELALNWLRKKYNLLTAEELSDAIFIMTGQRLTPDAIKKRRERLGLPTKRTPGPKPASEQ